MVFLDPTNDVAFKKLFGDRNHKDLLISFLNGVLERLTGKKIVDCIINDPNNYPEFYQPKDKKSKHAETIQKNVSKYSIVDVSATDEQGNHYIIEVQVAPQLDYGMRAQYYSSLAVSRQLEAAGKYKQLTPVIFIGVLGEDFKLFSEKHYLSHHLVLDTQNNSNELKLMEWHFIELEKFDLELNQLTTIVEKWIYFFKNAKRLHEIPKAFEKTEQFKRAFQILNRAVWTEKEQYEYEKKRDEIMSLRGQIEDAEEKGKAAGLIKGLMEGKKEQAFATAQAMLAEKFDPDLIARVTGLSIEEIEKLFQTRTKS